MKPFFIAKLISVATHNYEVFKPVFQHIKRTI